MDLGGSMTETFENFELTLGSFGQQDTAIDGVKYLTWFDLMDPNLHLLKVGAGVEYEARPALTVLCVTCRG